MDSSPFNSPVRQGTHYQEPPTPRVIRRTQRRTNGNPRTSVCRRNLMFLFTEAEAADPPDEPDAEAVDPPDEPEARE